MEYEGHFMTLDVTQIIIRYDQDFAGRGEVMLAGVPLLARTIISAIGEKPWESGRPAILVAGDYSAPYRHAVEAVVRQVAPDMPIDWQGMAAWPELGPQTAGNRILVITARGLYAGDFLAALTACAGDGDGFAATGSFKNSLENTGDRVGFEQPGFWYLTPGGYENLARGEKISPARLEMSAAGFCPVNDQTTALAAEKWLFRRFGKSTDGFISKYLNRPLSTLVSRRLVRTSVTPDHLTLLTAAFALLMFVVLKAGTPFSVAMGCLLYHVTSIVDGFDGEVARAKFLSTRRGASFDTAVDMATNVLFILGLTLGLAKIHGSQYLVLGSMVMVVALTAIALMAFVVWRGPKGGSFDVLQLAIRRRLMGLPVLSWLFEITNAILKRDFFALFFGLLGVFGLAAVIPWLLAAGMVAWLLAIIMAAPLVIGANPSEILPDHIGSLAVTKNSQSAGRPGE